MEGHINLEVVVVLVLLQLAIHCVGTCVGSLNYSVRAETCEALSEILHVYSRLHCFLLLSLSLNLFHYACSLFFTSHRSFTPTNGGDSATNVGLVIDGSQCASGMVRGPITHSDLFCC